MVPSCISISGWRLVPTAALLLLMPACGPGDDDDSAAPVDDDDGADDDDATCGDASGGAGGAVGGSWVEFADFGTPGDDVPDHEMLVYVPATLDPAEAAPVLVVVARRMPLTRAENEFALIEPGGLEVAAFADEMGWIAALPLPRPAGDGRLSWTDEEVDQDFFDASLDALETDWNIDRDRIWLFGSSAGGAAAIYLGWRHAGRVAAIMNHAGSNPFSAWPSTPWDDDCAALFVHDEADTVVPRAAVEDGALMFEDAGQQVEREYDYAFGHGWDIPTMNGLMADWFPRTCNSPPSGG